MNTHAIDAIQVVHLPVLPAAGTHGPTAIPDEVPGPRQGEETRPTAHGALRGLVVSTRPAAL